jgi:hypothetical protein
MLIFFRSFGRLMLLVASIPSWNATRLAILISISAFCSFQMRRKSFLDQSHPQSHSWLQQEMCQLHPQSHMQCSSHHATIPWSLHCLIFSWSRHPSESIVSDLVGALPHLLCDQRCPAYKLLQREHLLTSLQQQSTLSCTLSDSRALW